MSTRQSLQESHSHNSTQKERKLEETYQAIGKSIDEIQIKLKSAIDLTTSKNGTILDDAIYTVESDSKSTENDQEVQNSNEDGTISDDAIYTVESDSKSTENDQEVQKSSRKAFKTIAESKQLSTRSLLNELIKLVNLEKLSNDAYESIWKFVGKLNRTIELHTQVISGSISVIPGREINDFLWYAYVFQAFLESLKGLYKKIDNKVDPEKILSALNSLTIYHFVKLVSEKFHSESWRTPMQILIDFIEDYSTEYIPFDSKLPLGETNAFFMILEDETLKSKLISTFYPDIFFSVKNMFNFHKVYNCQKVFYEEEPGLKLRDDLDRTLAKAIKNHKSTAVDLIRKLGLKKTDLSRVCSLEFELFRNLSEDRKETTLQFLSSIFDYKGSKNEKKLHKDFLEWHFSILFEFLESDFDFRKAYSGNNHDLNLRDKCDKFLAKSIMHNYNEMIIHLIDKFNLKLEIKDLVRICRLEFEQFYKFDKNQKEIICDLFLRIDEIGSAKVAKKINRSAKNKNRKKRKEKFLKFIKQFNSNSEIKNTDHQDLSSQSHSMGEVFVDMDVKQSNEDEAVLNVQQELKFLIDNKNGHPKFDLKGKLEALIDQTNWETQVESSSQDENKESSYGKAFEHVGEFQKVLKKFSEHKIERETANRYESGSDLESWNFLNTCVKIDMLHQVVKQWQKDSEVVAEQATKTISGRKLSWEEQRQCKRFLYWQYIQALQIEQFIEERYSNIGCYDRRRDCYVLRAPNKVVQRAVSLEFPSMTEEVSDSQSTLNITMSSMAEDRHKLVESAHCIRLHTKAASKKNTHQQTFFGKLCRAAFVEERTDKVNDVVKEILQEKEVSDVKISESDQLAVCFLVTRPGAVNLLSDIKKVLKNDVRQVAENDPIESRTPKGLPTPMIDFSDISESDSYEKITTPPFLLSDDNTTHANEQKASLPVVEGKSFLLARVLEKNRDPSLPIFLTGTSAGLLLAVLLSEDSPELWPDPLKKLLKYLEERGGDFDFLTMGLPSHWDDLRTTKLKGQYSGLCEWTLWESSEVVSCSEETDPVGKPIQVKLDVVQIQRESESEAITDEALIQKYKTAGSCISTLGSFVLKITDHKAGAYELIFGDLDVFREQLARRTLGLVYPEQLEDSIEQFRTEKIRQKGIDAAGLKVLKFFNDVDCLSALSENASSFEIDPDSLPVIVKHQTIINELIRSIDFYRKKSFHRKIFQRAPMHLKGYFQLLKTFGFLEGFLMMNFDEMYRRKDISLNAEQRRQIKEYQETVRTFVNFLTIDIGKGVTDENVRIYLVVEQYFRHSYQSSSVEDFLKAMADIYIEKKSRETEVLFSKEKRKYREFIANKKKTLRNGLLGHQELGVVEDKKIFSVLSSCELVPELKRENPSSDPIFSFILRQHETLRSEINAQITNSIKSHSEIGKMSQVRLVTLAKPCSLSVIFLKDGKKKSGGKKKNKKKNDEDIKQKLSVFYLEYKGKHYAFSGVFEEEIYTEDSEREVRVSVRSETVNLLASLLRDNIVSTDGINLRYSIVAPSSGMLHEWMAIEKFKKNPYQSPILNALLLPTSSSQSLVADSQESARLIPKTLNFKQREAMSQVLRSLDEQSSGLSQPQVTVIKGPPGTGKTKVICDLTAALQEKGMRVLIVAHNNQVVGHIMATLLEHYPRLTLAGKVRTESKSSQITWSLDKLKECLETALDALLSVNTIPEAIARLSHLKRRTEQTMPLFSFQVHAVIHRLICEMTKAKSITKDMISNAKSEIEALFFKRPIDSETAVLAMANVMVGTLHGLAARHRTQAVLQWCSVVEPDRKQVLIVDESSQTSVQAILPTLLAKNDAMVVVGDPRQLEQTTHSQSPPASLLATCLKNIDPSRVISLEETYRPDPVITQLWSNIMYQGRVVCALSAAHQKRYADLRERLSREVGYLSATPLTLVDVDGRQEREEKSYKNLREAQSVVRSALDLLAAMAQTKQPWLQEVETWVAIIPVYRAQLDEIKKQLKAAVEKEPGLGALLSKLKVVTVDGSQGQEALYTLICTTRTQPASKPRRKKGGGRRSTRQHSREEGRSIGHAVEARRLNVALSRGQCGLFVFLELKLFETVTQKIMVKVVDELARCPETQSREGLFIQRSEASTDEEKKGGELSCLARGYHGKRVWCRLQASGETNLQVDVLAEKGGVSIDTLRVSQVSLSQIHSEDSGALTRLKCQLLNLLSTADNPHLASSVNWLLLLEFFEANRSESATTLPSKAIMGR